MRRISVYTLLETFIADLGGVVHTSIHPKIKNFCEGVFKRLASQSGSSVVVQLTLYKSGQSGCFQTNCCKDIK